MKIKKAFVISGICAALGLGVFGGLAANRYSYMTVKEAKADAEPNATFAGLPFGDAYNNTAFNSSYNQVLISYTGTAHGLDDTTSNFIPEVDSDMSLHVLLNGQQLASYAGSRVIAWNAQSWFRVVYPTTAIASGEGCTLEIKAGLTIGDAVFNQFTIGLNGEGKWEQRYFSSDVNSSFKSIYSDAYNNAETSAGSGYNTLMITYTGEAHNGSTIAGANLAKYNDLILIDGVSISAYAGGSTQIAPWGGSNPQKWFQVIYPTTAVSNGSVLTINEGTKIGNAVLEKMVFKLNSSSKWEYYFGNNAINATYNKIYSDAYNNVEISSGSPYNKLMFVYTGTAHGNPATIAGDELNKYASYVTLDGNPLPSGSQIAAWSDQTWITIIYPASSVSTGSTLLIKEGTKIGNAVLEKMVFKLNSSSKWEKLGLIADDPLVKNNDYMLFTPSDFGLKLQNDSIPFYGDVGSIFENSFAFQLNITIPAVNISTTGVRIRFGATNIYGSNPLFVLYLNDSTAKFMLGVGGESNTNWDWNTYSASPAWWTGDVTHLIEFYAIKTDNTNMVFLLGVDGELIWKTSAHDISGFDYTGHTFFNLENKGSTKDKTYYASAPTVEKALTRFGERKLKSNDVSFGNNNDTGACRGGEGYYANAKAFYNTFLTATQKQAFANESAYANLKARMIAWGAANGETISFNASTGALEVSASNRLVIMDPRNSVVLMVIITVSLLVMLTAGGVLYIRRKKEN